MTTTISSTTPSSLKSVSQAQLNYVKSVQSLNQGYNTEPDRVVRSIKLESQRRELIQKRLNQNQFRSLLQVADNTLDEITPALYRLHEIALRGLSTVISTEERSLLHAEAQQLGEWVNASVRSAHFNTKPLFDHHMNIQTLGDYSLETALKLDPLLETRVPNDDHEIVLIFDPSRSLTNVDDLFTKVVEAAQRYKVEGGDVSIGLAFAPITLNNSHKNQTPGPKAMAYIPPLNITNDSQGENLNALQNFLNNYEFGVGPINFGEAIQQVHDETDWSENKAHSLVVITTAGGEDKIKTIPDEINRFLGQDPRRHVSAIGMPSGNNTSSVYFDQLINQLGSGYYYDYRADLAFDEVVDTASGETRLISEVNISNSLYAQDTMTLVEDALDKLSSARGHLGALERRAEATIERHYSEELSALSSVEREQNLLSQQALAQRVSSEYKLKRAILFHRAEHTNHWQRFLELVNAHT